MSAELIAEARALLAQATPPPWRVADEIDGMRAGRPTVVEADDPGGTSFFRKLRVVTVDQTRPHFGSMKGQRGQDEKNVALIAAAPDLIQRLADALEAEHESHVETAEIMRRVQCAREALQQVSNTRQDIIDQLRAEKGAALADVKFWRTKAEEFDAMLDLIHDVADNYHLIEYTQIMEILKPESVDA